MPRKLCKICMHAFVAAIAVTVATTVQALTIAAEGTEGFSVIANGGEVFATYQGSSAGYNNDLYFNGTFIFNNYGTAEGTTVSLGSFDAGAELVFELRVLTTGYTFFSGPALRNPDGQAHARVETDWTTPGTTLVSFEDLFNGAFVFNDLSFSLSNTSGTPTTPIPEPQTYALMLAGLAVIKAMTRYRRK
ncbi:MAG: PEP-CTERM sorting domain-containing protein [Betaproteobacteria bacterium]|nr:PEP-CTERM sorting domain-containing protein [Betaproteobacteria bacterium]